MLKSAIALLALMVPATALAGDWTGPYVGVSVGHDWGSIASTVPLSGVTLDMQGGYIWTVGTTGLIVALQGDVTGGSESGGVTEVIRNGFDGNSHGANTYTNGTVVAGVGSLGTQTITNIFSSKPNWTGGLTVHVGYPVGPFVPYALGGISVLNNTISLSTTIVTTGNFNGFTTGGGDYASSANATHVGFTIGVGAEASLTDNISGFAEIRYTGFQTAQYQFKDVPWAIGYSETQSSVRAGLNYHF